ncbi:MAG: EamA family transporter [Candidatus Bathyarchaeia archaeon]
MIAFYASLRYSLGNSPWYYGVKHINLSKTTSIMIAYPLVSAVLAVFAIGETLSLVKIVGVPLVFVSTLKLSQLRSTSRE